MAIVFLPTLSKEYIFTPIIKGTDFGATLPYYYTLEHKKYAILGKYLHVVKFILTFLMLIAVNGLPDCYQ
jgi:hypothetical protein